MRAVVCHADSQVNNLLIQATQLSLAHGRAHRCRCLHSLSSQRGNTCFFELCNQAIHGYVMAEDGSKMSKSVGNTVDPFPVIEKYGSDALRMGIINERMSADDEQEALS